MLDLDHLSRQTLGNRTLENEVLELFIGQAEIQVDLIRATVDLRARREAAHALVGSARAIGAADVSRIAGEIERMEGPDDAAIEALAGAVADTNAFIRKHLAG